MTRLDAIRQRVEQASPGPWWAHRCEFVDRDQEPDQSCGVRYGDPADPNVLFNDASRDECHHIIKRVDADFIAHSREDIPALLRVAEAAIEYRRLVPLQGCHKDDADAAQRALSRLLVTMRPLLQEMEG